MDAILPAAGTATRMGGIPKFLLPYNPNADTLIAEHLLHLRELVDCIWVPTSEVYLPIVERILEGFEGVKILATRTKSMTETLQVVVEQSSSKRFVVVMPDTFFSGEKPYEFLSADSDRISVAAWKIREEQKGKLGQIAISERGPEQYIEDVVDKAQDCPYQFSWGAFSCSKSDINSADSKLPPGEILKSRIKEGINPKVKIFSGDYFDCGTPSEYFELIRLLNFR